MEKLDLKKELKQLYRASAKDVAQVDVPTMNFLMVDGEGDPNAAPVYAQAVEALFAVSYVLKFMVKKGTPPIDYAVMPLEGLWWADDMSEFAAGNKSSWKWTMMIAQPPFVTDAMVRAAIAGVREKKNPAAISRVRFAEYAEGKCAQLMHIGPFSAEGPAIARVHEFIEAGGGRLRGKHHEIYLSDIRKADPAKWKTIIRQPMRP